MDDFMMIIAIGVGIIIMILIPYSAILERNDDIAQGVLEAATSKLGDTIATEGAIKPSDYEAFIQEIAATGNRYDVEIEVQHLDENVGKKSSVTSPDLIGENVRYSTFTTEILNYMYEEDLSAKAYPLKKGDIVVIEVKNINPTMAQSLLSAIYKIVGKETSRLATSTSVMVVNTGTNK